MAPQPLLVLQMLASFVAWSLIAWIVVLPRLRGVSTRNRLLVFTIPHLFRHLGATQLSPMVGEGMPYDWAWHVGTGDGATLGLAIIAVIALKRDLGWARYAAWGVHVVGLADATFNGINAARLQVAPHLGAGWYVVAFGVPLIYIAHVLALRELIKSRSR